MSEELLSDDLDLDDALQGSTKEGQKNPEHKEKEAQEAKEDVEAEGAPQEAAESAHGPPAPRSPSAALAASDPNANAPDVDEMEVEENDEGTNAGEAAEKSRDAMDVDEGAHEGEGGGRDKAKSTSLLTSLFGGDSVEEEEEESSDDWRKQPIAHAAASTPVEAQKDTSADDRVEGGDEDHIEHDVRRDDFAQRRVDRHTLDLPELRLTKQPYATPDEDAKMVHVKPPLSLGFQPAAFDADMWNGEDIKPEYEVDAVGRKRMKRKIFDMIRWRHKRDSTGVIIGIESNARLVTFDDKSTFLFVGKEAYEFKESMFKDYHHLFARHLQDDEQPSFLECQGIIEHKAVLMPLNVVSKQQTALRARMKTMAKNKMASKLMARVTQDPEKEKETKEKMESTRVRLSREYAEPEAEPAVLTQDFLEGSDDDMGTYSGPYRRTIDPNLERVREHKMLAAKRGRPEVEEEEDELDESGSLLDEDEGLFDEEEEETEERPSKRHRK